MSVNEVIVESPAAERAVDAVVPRLLSVVEVADVLGTCTETVYRRIRRGELRSVHVGRAVRVRVDDLRAWLDARRR